MSQVSSQVSNEEVARFRANYETWIASGRSSPSSPNGAPMNQVPTSPTWDNASFLDRARVWLCENEPAIRFLQDLFFIAARWDDLLDKDQVLTDNDIHALMETALSLPCHPFFMQHFAQLSPLLHNAIRNWKVATTIERDPTSDECALMNAFILRASYIDILGHCAMLLKGNAWAEQVTREARLYNSREGFMLYRQSLAREEEVRHERR